MINKLILSPNKNKSISYKKVEKAKFCVYNKRVVMQLLSLSVDEGSRAEGPAGGVGKTHSRNDRHLGGETQEDWSCCTGNKINTLVPLLNVFLFYNIMEKRFWKHFRDQNMEDLLFFQERQKQLESLGISLQSSGIRVVDDKCFLVNLNADPALNELLVYYLKVLNIQLKY